LQWWEGHAPEYVPIWSSGTSGFPGARLVLRDDGNLIIVDAQGYQRWATNTAWYTPPAILSPGQKLTTSQELRPVPYAMTRLILQPDGNLVLYSLITGKAVWASNTQGKPMTEVTMQTDGNFVGRGPGGTVYWRAVTYGHPGAFLQLRHDGNLLVTDQAGTVFWQTNTKVPCPSSNTPCPPPP
jgi:hypothetical protein